MTPLTAEQLFAKKDFSGLTKKDWKNVDDIEANLWKTNIRDGPRSKQDFLDVSKEDFSMNKTVGIDGKEITPSSFNVMRDSLADTSAKLMETLQQNLPDLNLNESSTSGEDDDVLPLDFRTTMLKEEGRVVIQAKPLVSKLDDGEAGNVAEKVIVGKVEDMNTLLDAVH